MLQDNALSSPSSLLRAKEQRLQAAKRAMDIAVQHKDTDPALFETTKFQYYALKNGPVWARNEKMKLEREKLQPVVSKWRNEFQELQDKEQEQSSYMKLLQGLHNKQSALREQSEKDANALEQELQTKEAKVSAWNRLLSFQDTTITLPSTDSFALWFASFPAGTLTALNILLGIAGVFIVLFIVRRFFRPVADAVGTAATDAVKTAYETSFEIKPVVREVTQAVNQAASQVTQAAQQVARQGRR
jgi:hypothetical protein